ncbi:hypothetical protein HPB52_018104 [Rhipicephalus sanguineus]|uniref:Uncharacterized protein n=1 Tax=Rhipicephalus sanguineus TaxID=34632 RepID=A0A9D4QBX0_RHISA|nr:hypothetical protein HPB52_018104 [Rhipicephalus sanguineus]
MLTGSWWNIKASTISNCWRKAGLLETSLAPQDCEPTPRDCDDEVELDPELWNELTEKLPVDAAVTFEDYVDSDCATATSTELTCEEIISQVREHCSSSDEDDTADAEPGTTEQTISSSDVVVFLEKTRSYLGCCKDVLPITSLGSCGSIEETRLSATFIPAFVARKQLEEKRPQQSPSSLSAHRYNG